MTSDGSITDQLAGVDTTCLHDAEKNLRVLLDAIRAIGAPLESAATPQRCRWVPREHSGDDVHDLWGRPEVSPSGAVPHVENARPPDCKLIVGSARKLNTFGGEK